VSERCYGGLSYSEVGERAALRAYEGAPAHVDEPALPEPHAQSDGLRLVCYKPLFSGPAVERVVELQFQRPQAEVELARADAERRNIKTGDEVTLTGGGASVTLRARVDKNLSAGVVRVAREHAGGVLGTVEVTPAGVTA
jgi:anaerobic selenocysteine-containing dehydrogenase